MQNNRCIGPIHAVAQSANQWARQSHSVGSNLSGVIFWSYFYWTICLFYFKNKNNNCNVCKYMYLTTQTHMSEVEVYSVNKLKFWAMDKKFEGKGKQIRVR